MKRVSLISLLLLFTATAMAFAHAGEVHTYLGTVTTINTDGSFVMKVTTGEERTVLVSSRTTYRHADGRAAEAADVEVGKRVAAKIDTDGKTALTVKVSGKRTK